MYGLFKLLHLVILTFRDLLNVDRNALRNIPNESKYYIMVMLSLFWSLAFGIYMGELMYIGSSMIGHVSIITMAFVTWWMFKQLKRNDARNSYEFLRDPSRHPKCYEMTEDERVQAAAALDLRQNL